MSSRVNQVILILIDDVRSSHLFGLMDQGKLPNLAALAKSGMSSRECITAFPSITYPCYPTIITGSYTGFYPKDGMGIPSYHWVARTENPSEDMPLPEIRNYGVGFSAWKLNEDIGSSVKTIFEQAGEGKFYSALNLISRGSINYPSSKATVVIGYIWYMFIKRNISSLDWRPLDLVERVFRNPKLISDTNEIPKVTVAYIPGPDDLLHHKGYDHPKYIQELLNCDKYIGNLVKTLKEIGRYDDTAICVVCDHGNYKNKRMVQLESFFNTRGFKQYVPKKGFGDFDCTIGGIGFFNFPGKTWHSHPTVDQMKKFKPTGDNAKEINLFEMLWQIPEVKLMYHRDDANTPDRGVIHLERLDPKTKKTLKGKIEYEGHGKNHKTKYTFETEDLFGYSNDPKAQKMLDGNWHDINQWLAGTYHVDFPNFIDQLGRYFKNPRSCDIMIDTLGDCGFGYEHGRTKSDYPYAHDIALKEVMTVPLIIGGSPEVPNIQIPFCKTTDVVPTLLDLLGKTPHSSVVGSSLLNNK